LETNIQDLKGIWNYLLENEQRLRGRKGANLRGAFKRGNWWVLNTPRLNLDFSSEKIVTPYRTRSCNFAFSHEPWYASRDVYYITAQDPDVSLKYVLALLNSKVYFLWLFHKGKRKGDMLELYQKPLSEVPIPKIPMEKQGQYIEIVDKIIKLKEMDCSQSNNTNQKVKELEIFLDEMIFALFDLTSQEIELVMNSC
jgi:adenine-specific DNA-methyltransferase